MTDEILMRLKQFRLSRHGAVIWLGDGVHEPIRASDVIDLIEQQAARISELEAARIAYASEFPLNADGEPDVGNIHANIRAMKKDAERYRWLRERYIGFDFGWNADENGDNGKQVLFFEMDNGMRISADIDASIDAQIAASEPKKD